MTVGGAGTAGLSRLGRNTDSSGPVAAVVTSAMTSMRA